MSKPKHISDLINQFLDIYDMKSTTHHPIRNDDATFGTKATDNQENPKKKHHKEGFDLEYDEDGSPFIKEPTVVISFQPL
jgi:hypothetical protein